MVTENVFMKFGFKEENAFCVKETCKTKQKFKEIHIDIYPENPLVSSEPFLLLLRMSEVNATAIVEGDRLVLKRNDKYETHFMNVLIPKITRCFSKMCGSYSEHILKIQNVYYKITVLN